MDSAERCPLSERASLFSRPDVPTFSHLGWESERIPVERSPPGQNSSRFRRLFFVTGLVPAISIRRLPPLKNPDENRRRCDPFASERYGVGDGIQASR
jgi:hypothetical protein